MLPWIRKAQASLAIRPARRDDVPSIVRLLRTSSRSHLHADWRSPADMIGWAPAFVAENRYGLVGCLITPADPPPAAWIRAAAFAPGMTPAAVLAPLLEAALAALKEADATSLAAMPVEPWLGPVLEPLGFAIVEQVDAWEKPDLSVPRPGSSDTRVRAARPDEMPLLAAVDQAAFAPRWHHSAETLLRALEAAASFTVAEHEGQVAGFQFSQAIADRAHIVRLTVNPAAQGLGVGSRLLASALETFTALGLRTVSLNTQVDNLRSHRLYRAFGFRPLGAPLPVWERPI